MNFIEFERDLNLIKINASARYAADPYLDFRWDNLDVLDILRQRMGSTSHAEFKLHDTFIFKR